MLLRDLVSDVTIKQLKGSNSSKSRGLNGYVSGGGWYRGMRRINLVKYCEIRHSN